MRAFWGIAQVAPLVLLVLPASSQDTQTITGSATYRERIALPPGTVFEATLEDVSRADAPAEVVGRVRVEKPGQPPFRFSIAYDPARWDLSSDGSTLIWTGMGSPSAVWPVP